VLVFSTGFNMAFVADAETGTPIWVSSPDEFAPQYASLSADGRIVATVDYTYGRLRATDVRTGETLAEVSVSDAAPDLDPGVSGRPIFSEDGQYLDVPTNVGVARFGASDLRLVRFAGADQNIQGVRDVPGTSHVIGVGVGGRIWRWDMNTGELVALGRSRDSSSLTNVGVSPDGSKVAAYHPFSAQVALFDAATLRPIGRPFPVGDRWFTPRFTADGRFIIGNGVANGLTRWDVDPDAWQSAACRAAGRNLTWEEWTEYLGDEPYRPTCPDWPAPD
jgi:DNA-binding beta-propeller fold protein YncE